MFLSFQLRLVPTMSTTTSRNMFYFLSTTSSAENDDNEKHVASRRPHHNKGIKRVVTLFLQGLVPRRFQAAFTDTPCSLLRCASFSPPSDAREGGHDNSDEENLLFYFNYV